MKVGNHWEVGCVKEVVNDGEDVGIKVFRKSTKEILEFLLGSTHLARYHTFTSEKVQFEDVFVSSSVEELRRLGSLFTEELNNLRMEVGRIRQVGNILGEGLVPLGE